MRGVPVVIIPAGTSATGRYQVLAIPNSFRRHIFIVKTSAGVASGAVQPEAANESDYAGTWAPIGGGPVTVPAASSELAIEFEGVYNFLACRISTVIGGGTIEVTYEGS
jgi:hypothetical protein